MVTGKGKAACLGVDAVIGGPEGDVMEREDMFEFDDDSGFEGDCVLEERSTSLSSLLLLILWLLLLLLFLRSLPLLLLSLVVTSVDGRSSGVFWRPTTSDADDETVAVEGVGIVVTVGVVVVVGVVFVVVVVGVG